MKTETCSYKIPFTSSNYSAVIDKKLYEQIRVFVKTVKLLHAKLKKVSPDILEAFGVKRVPENLEDGFVFKSDKKDFLVVPTENSLWIRIQNPDTKRIEDSIYLVNDKIARTDTTSFIPKNVEFFNFKVNLKEKEAILKEIIDVADYSILKCRKLIQNTDIISTNSASTPMPAKPSSKTPVLTASEANNKKLKKTSCSNSTKAARTKKNKTIKTEKQQEPHGLLNEQDIELVNDITQNFSLVHEKLKSVKNSVTRNLIKNGYSDILKGVAGSKVLEFKTNHPYIKTISVNFINDHYKRNLVIKTNEYGAPDRIIVITPENEVFKSIPTSILRDSENRKSRTPFTFYSQEEIDSTNFKMILKLLQENLSKYLEFVDGKINNLNDFKKYHSNTQIGSVEEYRGIINDIYENLKLFVTRIKTAFPDVNSKARFKKINDTEVVTYQGNPTKIYLRDITPDRKTIQIKFAKAKGNDTVQILVVNNDTIEKTYHIIDGKMVKFDAKWLGMKPHYDRNIYYYTQDEIARSGLGEILDIIQRHIKKVNDKMS